jgi:hypothetical protein
LATCWKGGWTHLNLPAIAETEHRIQLGPDRYHLRRPGELLHPQREPQEVLDEFKRSMGSLDFAAQYQQEPVAEGGNLIKWKWFACYDRPPSREIKDKIILSWDIALSGQGAFEAFSLCDPSGSRRNGVRARCLPPALGISRSQAQSD